jgi:NTE family protein
VILAKGDLARAVRASMSIPVFFPPVSWQGRKLVDGLVVDNLPTDVAKLFGAAVTVASTSAALRSAWRSTRRRSASRRR